MPRSVQRARRRGQGGLQRVVPGPRARQALPQALPHRGVARRQAAAPAHLRDLRRGGRRQAALHRHGIRGRRHAGAVLPRRWAAAGRPRGRDRVQVHARARVRAQAGHHPPRHQARQHPLRRRHRREDHRLRRGADRLGRHHAGGRGRLARLHVARADPRAQPRPPHRHLFDGRGAVPPAHRAPAVPGGEQL